MSKFLLSAGVSGVFAAAVLAMAPAHADTPSVNLVNDPNLIQVADGCGPNGWRGPGGACHFNGGGWPGWGWRPYVGVGPYFGPGPYWRGGCGPGRWRAPHGHCRS